MWLPCPGLSPKTLLILSGVCAQEDRGRGHSSQLEATSESIVHSFTQMDIGVHEEEESLPLCAFFWATTLAWTPDLPIHPPTSLHLMVHQHLKVKTPESEPISLPLSPFLLLCGSFQFYSNRT